MKKIKLVQALITLLIIQIISYLTAMKMSYDSSHDGVSDFSGVSTSIIFSIFIYLGLANLILFLYYLAKNKKKKRPLNFLVVVLALVIFILFLTSSQVQDFIQRLPGSDLPGY